MTSPSPPKRRSDFEIAIICALTLEADAVETLFDKYWDEHTNKLGKSSGDTNAYTIGVIGNHNVVLAHMPSVGKRSAASVASSLRSSFREIKLALVVGICGGVPNRTDGEEILLGDIIISEGIIEYDFGRKLPDRFRRKDSLDSLGGPNAEIRGFLNKLKGQRGHKRLQESTYRYLASLREKPCYEKTSYPGPDKDKLFEPTYPHKHHVRDCEKCAEDYYVCQAAQDSTCQQLKCDEGRLVSRRRLTTLVETSGARDEVLNPTIHFGLIASGDTVMKSGRDRDEIAAEEQVIAFEMEGAGVWANLPCVIIKGVCDYADSHKNKQWQSYAAATAAACMKAFLQQWGVTDNSLSPTAPEDIDGLQDQEASNVREELQEKRASPPASLDRASIHPQTSMDLFDKIDRGDLGAVCNLLWDSHHMLKQTDNHGRTPLLFAARRGQKEILNFLLPRADIRAKDRYGQTVLHNALFPFGNEDMIDSIIEYHPDINATDSCGQTPLHLCVKAGKLHPAKVLLATGAQTEIPDENDETPAIVAAKKSKTNFEFVDLLAQYGAIFDRNAIQTSSKKLKEHLDQINAKDQIPPEPSPKLADITKAKASDNSELPSTQGTNSFWRSWKRRPDKHSWSSLPSV